MPRISMALLCLVALLLPAWASARISISGSLTHLYEAVPGDLIEGEVAINNSGDNSVDVRLYPTDYQVSPEGVLYPQAGTVERSSSAWLRLDAELVTVPPRGTVRVPYRVEVPPRELSGTYWHMLMVEQQPANALPEDGPPLRAPGAGGLLALVRYAIQISITVPLGASSELRFTDPLFGRDGRDSFLEVIVTNSGEIGLDPQHYVDIYDSGGNRLARFRAEGRRLYPGNSFKVRFELGELDPGRYLAIVVADSGGGEVFGARYDLQVEEE